MVGLLELKQNVFPGESGGDYGALFGYSQRPGGQFEGVNLTDMTVDEALQFSDPSGPYGQWVKGQVGRVATPMGAYQVVGTTLRAAKEGLGLTGSEKMDQATQDKIGQWIYQTQGPDAWEGWGKGGSSKGGTQMQPRVSTQGSMGSAAPMQAEDQPKWKNKDLWANLAITFNSMRMRPDAGLAQAMRSGIESRASQRKAAQNRNATADWLESQGATDLAAGVRGGAVPATTGLSMYQVQAKAASDPNVQTSQMLPDASGSVLTMRDGSLRVVTSGGETLTGQEAMDFVRQAQERGVQYEREKFGARRQGTLGADIEMGSEAEAAKAWGKEAPKVVGEFAERAGLVRSNISNIDDAIAAIDEGAESGIVYNMLPNITEASASLNNAMNRMGLDVIGSVTFGALSEGEMRLAMETAVPRNLSPTELRSWLVKKREAQAKAYAALNEAIQFIASGRSPAEYYATFGAGEGAKPKQAAPSSGDLSDEDLLKKYGG